MECCIDNRCAQRKMMLVAFAVAGVVLAAYLFIAHANAAEKDLVWTANGSQSTGIRG